MPVEIAGNAIDVQPMRGGERKSRAIAGGEQVVLALLAAAPDRSDRVNDMGGVQAIASRDFGRARVAAAERAAFGEQFRSGGTMDGAVHTAPAQQG